MFRRAISGHVLVTAALWAREQRQAFKIQPLPPVPELRAAAMAAQPPAEHGPFRRRDLVELVKLDPTIKLDIHYASAHNFRGVPSYSQARAFLQRPAAEALMLLTAARIHGLWTADLRRLSPLVRDQECCARVLGRKTIYRSQ